MVKLQIRCPSCSKTGFIEVSNDELKKASRGLFAVNISEEIICEHSFVAYVDKNFVVRDTFIADFKIELPNDISNEPTEVEKDSSDLFKTDLIKLNLTASLITYVIRAMIYKKKIIIISDQKYFHNQILNFFNYIIKPSFNIDIIMVTEEDYKNKTFGDHFAFKERGIITDYNDKINSTKLNVEKAIVQKFLNEYDPMISLIILKNEIQKVFKLSKTIIDIIKNLKENEKLYSKKMVNQLKNKHNIKISIPYLNFLYEIVESYFEVEIPRSSGISNFLDVL